MSVFVFVETFDGSASNVSWEALGAAKTVADALGHSDTRNTIKYLNYIDSLKDDAVDNLPDIQF